MITVKDLSILNDAMLAIEEYIPQCAKLTHIEMEDGSGCCFNCIVERTYNNKTVTRREFFVIKNRMVTGNNVIEIIEE